MTEIKHAIFLLFVIMALWETKLGAEEKILLVSIGKIDVSLLQFLRDNLQQIFEVKVNVASAQSFFEESYNPFRKQYNSSRILEKYIKPQGCTKVLLIFENDLYCEGLNFVFGEADILKGVAIISTARLNNRFYGLPEDEELFKLRTLKEAVHELGHLYGLAHCPDPSCVMHFSNTLLDTDRKSFKFCPKCRKKLEREIERKD